MEEGLQGHINPFMSLECLEEEGDAGPDAARANLDCDNVYDTFILNSNPDDPQEQMPFLQMLLEQRNPQPSFQLLLKLREYQNQPLQPRYTHWTAETDFRHVVPSSLESCVTHASESQSENRDHPASFCIPEPATTATDEIGLATGPQRKERRKRKRSRPSKNAAEVESQRMTHITVERNRRKLMNDHLNSLRSLMPSSFVPRNNQASIVGGAIDFVKELEQLLQSLHAEQRMRTTLQSRSDVQRADTSTSPSPFRDFFTSPQYSTYTSPAAASSASSSTAAPSSPPPPPPPPLKVEEEAGGWTGVVADVEVTVLQSHVNLKVLSPRRPRQLVRAVAAMEELHLAVLHLNVTSVDDAVFYSLNLKIEEECKLGSADEIATAVHQIFSYISSTS